MSKWAVLKAAISGRTDEVSLKASIHRHDGFSDLLSRKRIFWTWTFSYWVRTAVDADRMRAVCSAYTRRADCAEIRVVFRIRCSLAAAFRVLLAKLVEADPAAWRVGTVERVPSKKRAKRKRRGHKSKRDGLSSRVEAIQQVEVFFHDRSREPLLRAHELCCYSVPAQAVEDCAISAVSVYTREVPKAAGVTAKGIISHKLHGVDNTGNVRVWTSECILLRVLLSSKYRSQLFDKQCLRSVLELGGGMTALCGLGLAVLSDCASVTTTDGHPDAVTNQSVCIELCKQKHPKLFQARQKRSFDLTAKLLRWSRDDKIGDLRKLLSGASFDTDRAYPNFDVIIASDCLFFKDFHHDLYWLLKAAIAPGGVVFLLQPRRGRTLDIFIDIVKSDNFFSFEISDNYLCEVSELHHKYLSMSSDKEYDPDVHYPLLITLKKSAL